jgi:drug/metabolite transporter (DMT)-like permease
VPLSARAQANLDFIALCWIWGSTWLAIKIGLTNVPPATSAAIRFVIAGVLLFGIVLATRAKLPRSAHFSWLVAGQGAQLAINYYLIYWAEQTVPSGLTAVLFAVFPIFTSAIAALIFRIERFGPVNVLGLALGVAGLCIIFWSEVLLAARTSWLGMTAVVLSALVAAFGTTTMKRWGHEFPPLAVAAPSQLACGVLLAGFALVVDRTRAIAFTPVAIGSIAYLAVFGSAVAFVSYYRLLRIVSATRAALLTYVTPIVAVVLGAVVAHETIGLRTLAGAALVFASIGLVHVPPEQMPERSPADPEV